MSIFGGGGFCLMAFENAERRLKPDKERIEFRERPNHMAGRNTKFPFSQEMIKIFSISLIRETLNWMCFKA